MFAALIKTLSFQGDDSSGRKFKVAEAVQQLQCVYEAVASSKKQKSPNSVRRTYMRKVWFKLEYEKFSTESNNWFPQPGAFTAALVSGIYNRITVDFFDENDPVAFCHTVTKTGSGVQHLSTDLS